MRGHKFVFTEITTTVPYYDYKSWGIKVEILMKNKTFFLKQNILNFLNYGWGFKGENNLCDIGAMDFCLCFSLRRCWTYTRANCHQSPVPGQMSARGIQLLVFLFTVLIYPFSYLRKITISMSIMNAFDCVSRKEHA